MKAAIVILSILLLVAIGAIILLAWRLLRKRYDPLAADKFIKAIDGLIQSRLNELEGKLKREYKTDDDVNNSLDELGFRRE